MVRLLLGGGGLSLWAVGGGGGGVCGSGMSEYLLSY